MLNYRIDGSGPKVVLLHPVGLDLTCFEILLSAELRGYEVLRVDLPGHGSSPLSKTYETFSDYARDLHDLLRSLNFFPAVIVGFSFGGMLAQTLALEYPADVSALVISACASTFPDNVRPLLAKRGLQAQTEGMVSIVEPTMQRWFTEGFRNSQVAERFVKRLLNDDPRGWAQAWSAISKLETHSRLNSIKVPTLCLAGEEDLSAPPPVVEAIAKEIPGAQFQVLPAAPHMLFIEQPRAVAKAILEFLS